MAQTSRGRDSLNVDWLSMPVSSKNKTTSASATKAPPVIKERISSDRWGAFMACFWAWLNWLISHTLFTFCSETERQYLFYKQWRSDKDDDQRLDNTNKVKRDTGIYLHLSSARF